MKNLWLFLSMDAGLISDTQLIYRLKITESQVFTGIRYGSLCLFLSLRLCAPAGVTQQGSFLLTIYKIVLYSKYY